MVLGPCGVATLIMMPEMCCPGTTDETRQVPALSPSNRLSPRTAWDATLSGPTPIDAAAQLMRIPPRSPAGVGHDAPVDECTEREARSRKKEFACPFNHSDFLE